MVTTIKLKSSLVTGLAILSLFFSASEVRAKYKPVNSNDLYHSNKNARVLYMQAQMALRGDDLERAIKLGKKAVELDPEDMDARVVYGDALFRKYQNDKDNTKLYNECVKTWLMVHRNVVGSETGTGLKGVGIPLANKFFEDEGRGILAKKRLRTLCGRLPKFWETNRKYLKKVLIPETKVAGSIVSENTSETTDSEAESEEATQK